MNTGFDCIAEVFTAVQGAEVNFVGESNGEGTLPRPWDGGATKPRPAHSSRQRARCLFLTPPVVARTATAATCTELREIDGNDGNKSSKHKRKFSYIQNSFKSKTKNVSIFRRCSDTVYWRPLIWEDGDP